MDDIIDAIHSIIAVPVYIAVRLIAGQVKMFWSAAKRAWKDA